MCKVFFSKIFLAAFMIAAVMMSCAKDGQDGKDGKDGENGSVVTIVNGYLYIDGVNTGISTDGTNGSVVTIQNGILFIDGESTGISGVTLQDGYLYINGVSTGISVEATGGSVVTVQDGYLYIDGVNTGISTDGTGGSVVTIQNGNLYIDGVDTGISTNSSVVTMQDGFLYINGVNTGISTGGGGDANVFTVSYDTDGATPAEVRSENVIAGGLARKPVIALTKTPIEGLYVMDGDKISFLGWHKVVEGVMESDEFDFDNTPITANTTLKARWSIDLAQIEGTNIVDKSVAYINANPGAYALMLENDYEVATRQRLNVAGVSLTLKGLDSKRTLAYTNASAAEEFIHLNASGVQLILEENIVLTRTGSEGIFLIHVQNGNLTLDGAEITGVTNMQTGTWTSAIVYVTSANSSFDMKSGKIHANAMRHTEQRTATVQIYGGNPRFAMTGGEITGNVSNFGNAAGSTPDAPADVFIQSSNFFLSGDAKISSLMLNRFQDNVKLTGAFGGAVDALNLYADGVTNVEAVIAAWQGNNVMQGSGGYTPTQTDVDKFTLGNFVRNATIIQPISPTHELVIEGNNVVLREIETEPIEP